MCFIQFFSLPEGPVRNECFDSLFHYPKMGNVKPPYCWLIIVYDRGPSALRVTSCGNSSALRQKSSHLLARCSCLLSDSRCLSCSLSSLPSQVTLHLRQILPMILHYTYTVSTFITSSWILGIFKRMSPRWSHTILEVVDAGYSGYSGSSSTL